MNVSFDPEFHRYTLDGRRVPGVTNSIEAVYRQFDGVESDELVRKRSLGLAVHYGTQLYDEGTLDFSSLHPDVRPGVEAYIELRRVLRFVPVRIESVVASTLYRFAGREDRFGYFESEPAVFVSLDLKFVRKLSPATALQTAAYAQAGFETYGVMASRRFAAQLGADGKPRIKEYGPPRHSFRQDLAAYLSVLNSAVFGWDAGLLKGGF